jgi:hypothetical protein
LLLSKSIETISIFHLKKKRKAKMKRGRKIETKRQCIIIIIKEMEIINKILINQLTV